MFSNELSFICRFFDRFKLIDFSYANIQMSSSPILLAIGNVMEQFKRRDVFLLKFNCLFAGKFNSEH